MAADHALGRRVRADRITVLNFDRSKRNNTTLQDLLASLSPALANIDLTSAKPVPGSGNESLPADLLEFKRIAKHFGEFGLQGLLQKMLDDGYAGSAFRMPPQMAREIIETFRSPGNH